MNLKNNSRNLMLWFNTLIKIALKEDIATGDITSQLLIPANKKVKAVLILKEKSVIAGLSFTGMVFKAVDKTIKFKALCVDGTFQPSKKIIALIEGNARSVLLAERTALNFLSHVSGVAAITREFVEKIKPYKTKIMDTRKTIPGLRYLEKYAVMMGGGYNHRMCLGDEVLIKDNHLKLAGDKLWSMNLKKIRSRIPSRFKIEIEVKTLKEFEQAFKIKPDIIMLDNMGIEYIKKAVKIRSRLCRNSRNLTPKLEVSGGVSLDNVRAIAATGVDAISVGALTHSVRAIDISLEIIKSIN